MVPGSVLARSERAATATAAPSRARAAAIVAPMPRLAPAAKAVFPSSRDAAVTSAGSAALRRGEMISPVHDDALGQLGILGRTPHPLGEGHLGTPVLLELIGGFAVGGCVDGSRGHGVDANTERRQVACGNQRHAQYAALGSRVGELTRSGPIPGDRCGVDDTPRRPPPTVRTWQSRSLTAASR